MSYDIVKRIEEEKDKVMIETLHKPNRLMIWEPHYDVLFKRLREYCYPFEQINEFMDMNVIMIATDDTWSMTKELRELIESKGFLLYREGDE